MRVSKNVASARSRPSGPAFPRPRTRCLSSAVSGSNGYSTMGWTYFSGLVSASSSSGSSERFSDWRFFLSAAKDGVLNSPTVEVAWPAPAAA